MNMQRRIFASTGIVLIFATASLAQQVKTDYDREANFNQYKTYSWEKVQTQDSLWVDRIKEAVNTDLAAKGWTPVQSGGTLVVDLFDPKTKQLIWRGSASDALSNKSDKNIRNLDKGVQKMFDHFPPGGKK